MILLRNLQKMFSFQWTCRRSLKWWNILVLLRNLHMSLILRNVAIYGTVIHHPHNNYNRAGQTISYWLKFFLVFWELSHSCILWHSSPYIHIKRVAIRFRQWLDGRLTQIWICTFPVPGVLPYLTYGMCGTKGCMAFESFWSEIGYYFAHFAVK